MDIIFSASIIAAFVAGMVALFAPCCITVLLPAYLATAFREKKRMLLMTLIFFSGIAVVLIPIGLGAAGLAKLFESFHKELYIFGGLFMIVLAVLSVAGKGLALIPMRKRAMAKLDVSHPKSVFMLGLFSGAATSCCAPVLAGAVTLAVLSGTFWKALVVTFVYVFGMTFPLFITAYLYDRFKIDHSKLIRGKLWELHMGKRTFYVHSTNLIAGIIFFAMGAILLFLAFSGNMFWAPSYQVQIGNALNRWSNAALEFLTKVPDIIWGLIIIGIFLLFIIRAMRVPKDKTYGNKGSN